MKVINIGSLNLDRVYEVDHIVNGKETLASSEMETFVGGKGLNQSTALALAGAEVLHAGMTGEDGEILKEFLSTRGVDTRLIRTVERASGHAIIQIDKDGQNAILIYGGANQCLTEEYIDEVLETGDEGDIVLIQNETNGLDYIIRRSVQLNMRVAFNPSPIDSRLRLLPLQHIAWFFINEIEGNALTGETCPEKILKVMTEKYPESEIVLTLGEEGAVVKSNDGIIRQEAFQVKAVDTTAAGDTFTGYYLAGIVKGMNVADRLKIAAKAASIAVSRKGAAPSVPTIEEVV